MDPRKVGENVTRSKEGHFLYPESDWPRVYSMNGLHMLLLAGRMVLDPNNTLDFQSTETNIINSSNPVDAATCITWLQRHVDHLNEKSEEKSPGSVSRLLPPTLPIRMRGKVGVIEYEMIDREKQKRLVEKRKERKQRKNRMSENRKSNLESRKRKMDETASESLPEMTRPKRLWIPNSRYDRNVYMCPSPVTQRMQ